MTEAPPIRAPTYLGLFLITLSTLTYQILLTRIFSVTMWYHFAFLAISVSMFGMTVGALIVYLRPGFFRDERAGGHLASSAILFAASIPLSFLLHINIPFHVDLTASGVLLALAHYLILSIPFVLSGICVCLALTKFPGQVNRLYAADLSGAAMGCVALIFVLRFLDAPTAVFAVALVVTLGAAAFAYAARHRGLLRASLAAGAGLALLITPYLIDGGTEPLLRLKWVKGRNESPSVYEKWNSFSRVRVSGDPTRLSRPFGWGISPTYWRQGPKGIPQLILDIDASARTWLTGWSGSLGELEHLKYDIVNLVHYLRREANVFVIGAGGGRDVLSALAFEQKSVIAAEINGAIIESVNGRFGDFTGHLDRNPRVEFAVADARSYIARQTDRYDIIQISLVDTWAATAAGAFVLAENSLYTLDAWEVFFDRLKPDGVLSVSRNYIGERPAEVYRLTSLAVRALLDAGVENPRDHIFLLRHMYGTGNGIGTMLISKAPFSSEDLARLQSLTRVLGFPIILAPDSARDPVLEELTAVEGLDEYLAEFPIDISAPTDNKPFFFQMLRFRDLLNEEARAQGGTNYNMAAVVVLGVLVCVVLVLTALCILVPLLLTRRRLDSGGVAPFLLFFACIGFGFMFIEISLMQRLIIFLGHPTYGLSVVLFALLLSGGAGSFLAGAIPHKAGSRLPSPQLVLLVMALVACGVSAPFVFKSFQGSTTPVRIGLALALLLPTGLFMGMAFPLGLRLAAARSNALTPWLWGVNGATSVCGSVLAVVIALAAGISTTFWTGVACYLVANLAFVLMTADSGLRTRGTGPGEASSE